MTNSHHRYSTFDLMRYFHASMLVKANGKAESIGFCLQRPRIGDAAGDDYPNVGVAGLSDG